MLPVGDWSRSNSLGTPEDWTRVWTQVEHPCLALHGYPVGLDSLSAYADRLVKSVWARVSHAQNASFAPLAARCIPEYAHQADPPTTA